MHVKITPSSKYLSTDCAHQSESNKLRIYFNYVLLDTGSESTLIRSDFAKTLNLRKNSKIVNISNIKDSGGLLNEHEIKSYVTDKENTSIFHINKALAIKRERFNSSAQFLPLHFQQNGEWTHLQGLKLSNINPSDAMVVISADVPEAFIQLDIRKVKEDQPLAIRTPFKCTIFGSSKKRSPAETKEVLLIQ